MAIPETSLVQSQLIQNRRQQSNYLNYRRMFPGALVLPAKVPAELLPFALGGRPDCVLTASSTSIGGLAPYARKCYSFGTEIETHWQRLHLMFAAARVLRHMEVQGASVCRMNSAQMRNLLDVCGIPGTQGALVDGGLLGYDEISPSALLTLLLHFEDSAHDAAESDIRIHVRLIPEEGSLLQPADYVITARCEEEAMRARLRRMKEQIELKYSKAILEIKSE